MNLEKVGLFLFLKHVRQLDVIKKHVLSAVRELVLALTASVELVGQATADHQLAQKVPFFEDALSKIDIVLNFALKFLPISSEDRGLDLQAVKLELFESVITVIEEEQARLGLQDGHQTSVQIGALESIKKAFLSRMGASHDGPLPAGVSGVRKVVHS